MRSFLIVFLFITPFVQAQVAETRPKSTIDRVTVFLDGAQIHRTASISLVKGNNIIRLKGLSQYITQNSVQVKGQNSFKIVSVSQEINHLDQKEETPRIKELKQQLDALENELKRKNADEQVFQSEKEMILFNKNIAGDENGVDMIELLDIADYYRGRLNTVDDRILEIQQDKKDLNKRIGKLTSQLVELGYEANRPTGEILVKLSADRASTAKLEFSYMVGNAGWSPLYDVRSEDITGPIELTYRGNVYQNTGQDWDKVQLTLSTGNPRISGTKPGFNQWTLENRPTSSTLYSKADKKGRQKVAESYDEAESTGYFESDGSSADFTTVSDAGVNTEFKIDLPYTIPSDGKQLSVEIKKYSLPVEYQYYAVPRLDPDAFLISRVSGWDEYYLLSGSANIYYRGTYVGSSYINTQETSDTLIVSLGRDNNIVVQRERIKDVGGTSFIGSNRKTEIGMKVSLKNTKNTTITIEIEDQIPISTTKEIEVSLVESAGAIYTEETGNLKWKLILGPGESRDIRYRYTVKAPKDYIMTNL